ncbi:MAG: malonyl-ACP O-methyltransferase BioC [Methylococcales bacterium]|nr:malonyl-ACP O-methyltransferase BioC [Methylococcales bacterium]
MSNVIDRDKYKVRQAFAQASVGYDDFAHLQRTVANGVLKKNAITSLHGNVLDIGCGTGFLTQQLQNIGGYQQLMALDIAVPMLQKARQRLNKPVSYVCGDAEHLPFQSASLDSIFSGLALQWCQHLPTALQDFRRALKPGGRLVFTTFGAETLRELKQAWRGVDQCRHVNDFYTPQQLQRLLLNDHWRTVAVDSQLFRPHYASVMTLMRELKGIGAQSVSSGRKQALTTKTDMQAMMNAYPRDASMDGVFASFEIIWVTAEAHQ